MTELRRRMLEEPGLRNYSGHTIEVYLCCVAKFAQKTGFRRIGSGRSISANISYSWSRRKRPRGRRSVKRCAPCVFSITGPPPRLDD